MLINGFGVVKRIIMTTNVEAPVKQKNLRSTQDLSLMIDNLLIILICFIWNTQVSFFTNAHFQPMSFPFLPNTPSLALLICCSLFLSHSLSAYSPICLWRCDITGEVSFLFQIYSIRHLYSQHPGANVIKLFCPQFNNFRNKLDCLPLASSSSEV